MKLKSILIIILTLTIIILPEIALSLSNPLSKIRFPNEEETTMQVYRSNGKIGTRRSKVFDRGSSYLIRTIEEDGSTSKMFIDKKTLKPLVFYDTDPEGKTIRYAKFYKNNKMYLAFPEDGIEKTVNIPENAYDMQSLYYVFRAFPFEKDEINVNLVMHDPGNIRNVGMTVKKVAVEEIEVASGKFVCYKLEMGCSNIIERVFWPHKYYFWYTVAKPHHFVKFAGKEADLTVVTNELLSYKVGKRYVVKVPR